MRVVRRGVPGIASEERGFVRKERPAVDDNERKAPDQDTSNGVYRSPTYKHIAPQHAVSFVVSNCDFPDEISEEKIDHAKPVFRQT